MKYLVVSWLFGRRTACDGAYDHSFFDDRFEGQPPSDAIGEVPRFARHRDAEGSIEGLQRSCHGRASRDRHALFIDKDPYQLCH